ncbi:uncharacterized protein LOC133036942 [Cannabis sativa]|uniref:uncharacterized protein LOC133036942 n=1 Tax=Cannabis sativa TaxID=3483 RepID=UPI0029CA96E1|nr:uncharacterized protein LOC133036942 [Cannabis sativa]
MVSEEEIKRSLFHMHLDKSPGPDGMTPGFFQKYWNIVKMDVVAQVRAFFDNVISKVLANQIKVVLPHVISPNQFAFIPGRLISDNIMIAFEVMHYLKRKRKGKEGYMALKLDLSKAYDRVEWSFLRAMMEKMGFANHFVDLILAMVNSVKYKIVHGGHDLESFVPRRGIRQGDPLSPYPFLICAEGFTSLIRKFEHDDLLKGCKVANGAPIISHMLFADDSYVYCRTNERKASNILRLLHLFEAATGQQVNFSKSSIFFRSNTPIDLRNRLCTMLGMSMADERSTYLGLPCTMGRNEDAILGFLKEKMQKRIRSWEGRLLLKAGREILLKTVAQALPTYAMSVFLLPLKTCSHLESLMSKYWWGSSNNRTKGLIRDGARRRIDSGDTTPVLNVPWLMYDVNLYVLSTHPALSQCKVSNLMQVDNKQWDLEVITDLFESRDIDLILKIPLSNTLDVDTRYWSKEPSGFYSVKSSYQYLQELKGDWSIQMESDLWRILWKVKVPPKVLHFAWKAISGCLPTRTQLLRIKHVPVESLCVFCNSEEESILHVLVDCPFANSCWNRSGVGLNFYTASTFTDWFKGFLVGGRSSMLEEVLMVGWGIWKAQNELLWKGRSSTVAEVVRLARNAHFRWMGLDGSLIEAYSTLHNGACQPALAEVLSVKEALSWLKLKNFLNVLIETDCIVVVQAMYSSAALLSVFNMFIQECQMILDSLNNVLISHVKRFANKAAHCVARGACFWSDRLFTESNIPSALQSIVIADITV